MFHIQGYSQDSAKNEKLQNFWSSHILNEIFFFFVFVTICKKYLVILVIVIFIIIIIKL